MKVNIATISAAAFVVSALVMLVVMCTACVVDNSEALADEFMMAEVSAAVWGLIAFKKRNVEGL